MKRPYGDEPNTPRDRPAWHDDDEPTEVISLPPDWLSSAPPPAPDYPSAPAVTANRVTDRTVIGITLVRVIGYLTGLIQGLLLVRVFFRAIGANPTAPAAQWVYALSEPLIVPFTGLLPEPRAGDFALELATLFAVVIYTVTGFLLRRLVALWLPSRAAR